MKTAGQRLIFCTYLLLLLGVHCRLIGAELVLSGDPVTIRKVNSLNLIWSDVEKAVDDPAKRSDFLREFLTKSESILPSLPDKDASAPMMWARRTFAACELEEDVAGAAGGRKMIAMGLESNPDPLVQKTLAMLEEKGWLKAVHAPAIPKSDQSRQLRWTNSLGMVFTSVPGTGVLFSIWETRVSDFRVFARKTGYDATQKVYSITKDKFQFRGNSWSKPGFPQTIHHPVAGISWLDARAFCRWLTDYEVEKGVISSAQEYRLPDDSEWTMAAGEGKYPWGNDLQVVRYNGNYAGLEVAGPDWPKDWGSWSDYRDDFARTAPVASFQPNQRGIYDLGGNVWEWCNDWYDRAMNSEEARKLAPTLQDDGGGRKYRVLRGAAWDGSGAIQVSSAFHNRNLPETRNLNYGFRCVLAQTK